MPKPKTTEFKNPDRSNTRQPKPKTTEFKNPDHSNTRQPLDINSDKPGNLATKPIDAELVDEKNGDRLRLFSLVEQASGFVSKFTQQATNRLQETETLMSRLVSGDMTVDDLVNQYGELSTAEAEAERAKLARVMNAIAVESDKLDATSAGIKVQAKRAFVALGGLKEAFKLQAEGERVADAHDEATYQAEVRDTNNAKRDQDIDYRIEANRLDKEDKDSRIGHKTEMNSIANQFRQAVRKGANAGLTLQQNKTDAKVSRINQIIGKGDK